MVDESNNPNQMLSANRAGKLLGVSGKTMIRMMEDGEFSGYKVGSAYKFKRGEIQAYLESKKVQGKKSEPQEGNLLEAGPPRSDRTDEALV
jgi:excisionase family DNA binding protein